MARAAPYPYRRMSPLEAQLLQENIRGPSRALVPARKGQSFIERNKGPVVAVGFAAGLLSVNRLDLIPFQPMAMGRKVPPSVIALAATFVGAILADKWAKRRDVALLLASVSAGIGVGVVKNAVTEATEER